MGTKLAVKEAFSRISFSFLLFLTSLVAYLAIDLIYSSAKLFTSELSLNVATLVIVFVLYCLILVVQWSKYHLFITYFGFPLFYAFAQWIQSDHLDKISLNKEVYFLILIVLLFLHAFYSSLHRVPIYTKQVSIILFAFVILLVGLIIVTGLDERGNEFGFRLNDCQTVKKYNNAELICKNSLGAATVGSLLECKFENINMRNVTGRIDFTQLNGTKIPYEFKDTIQFILPAEVTHSSVKIYGIEEGKNICLSSGFSRSFLTYEEYKEYRKDMATYVAALIGFILISFPTIYLGWKKLLFTK